MKKILFTALFISFINISHAQFLQSGIALTAVTPMGTFSDVSGAGYGGVFMAKFGLPVLDITGSVEYLNFSEKEVGTIKYGTTMWGVNAGARISVFPFLSAGAELGNYWVNTSAKGETIDSDDTVNKIAITPLIAATFTMFEASIRYVLIDKTSFLALRAGIYF